MTKKEIEILSQAISNLQVKVINSLTEHQRNVSEMVFESFDKLNKELEKIK